MPILPDKNAVLLDRSYFVRAMVISDPYDMPLQTVVFFGQVFDLAFNSYNSTFFRLRTSHVLKEGSPTSQVIYSEKANKFLLPHDRQYFASFSLESKGE